MGETVSCVPSVRFTQHPLSWNDWNIFQNLPTLCPPLRSSAGCFQTCSHHFSVQKPLVAPEALGYDPR